MVNIKYPDGRVVEDLSLKEAQALLGTSKPAPEVPPAPAPAPRSNTPRGRYKVKKGWSNPVMIRDIAANYDPSKNGKAVRNNKALARRCKRTVGSVKYYYDRIRAEGGASRYIARMETAKNTLSSHAQTRKLWSHAGKRSRATGSK